MGPNSLMVVYVDPLGKVSVQDSLHPRWESHAECFALGRPSLVVFGLGVKGFGLLLSENVRKVSFRIHVERDAFCRCQGAQSVTTSTPML